MLALQLILLEPSTWLVQKHPGLRKRNLGWARESDHLNKEQSFAVVYCHSEHNTIMSCALLKPCFHIAGIGESGLCSIFSPSFVHWEAMTFFLESVINQMFRTLDKDVSNCFPCWLCNDFDLLKTGRGIGKSMDVYLTEEETDTGRLINTQIQVASI